MAKVTSIAHPGEATQKAIIRLTDQFTIIDGQLKAVEAILDATRVLTALERAPAHHDTHPSHLILTGGGWAAGHRLNSETLPDLMDHAHTLVQMTRNDTDCMREEAIDVLQKGGFADGG